MKISYLGIDNGNDLRLFSVEERKNPIDSNYSDINLYFPGKGLFKTSNSIEDLIRDVNLEEYERAPTSEGPHISVHYEPNKHSIFVNRSTSTKQGCNYFGIKQGNLFAPILLRIFGNTNKEQYFAKDKHKRRGVNSEITYTSSTDTLVMMFAISSRGVVFNKDVEYPANYIERELAEFRLTAIYRYFNMPSEEMTINFFQTAPPSQIIKGYEWGEVCNLLNILQDVYTRAYFNKYPSRNYRY